MKLINPKVEIIAENNPFKKLNWQVVPVISLKTKLPTTPLYGFMMLW